MKLKRLTEQYSYITESCQVVSETLLENDIQINSMVKDYDTLVNDILKSNNGSYDSDIHAVIQKATIDIMNSVALNMEYIRSELITIHKTILEKLSSEMIINNDIIFKHKPIIDKCDVSKYLFTPMNYTLDNLNVPDAISRIFDYTRTLDMCSTNIVENIKFPDSATIVKNVKQAILGVTSDTSILDFSYCVNSRLVNGKKERMFDDGIYSILQTDYSSYFDIFNMINIIMSEYGNVDGYRNLLNDNGLDTNGAYYRFMRAKYFATLNLALSVAIVLIVDILQEKLRLLLEMFDVYRNMITYVGKDACDLYIAPFDVFFESTELYDLGYDSTLLVEASDITDGLDKAIFEQKLFKSPEDLSKWMKTNISYRNFTHLMTPEEVFIARYGSCHDQAFFISYVLTKMGIENKKLFFMECNNVDTVGGMTHTLVYYHMNDKIYWIENAWNGQEGIHVFNTIQDLKAKIKQLHLSMSSSSRYPNIEFENVGYIKYGIDLKKFTSIIMDT